MKGAVSYRTVKYNINISDGSIVRSGEIDKEEAGFNWITFPSSVVWFKNNLVVPFTNAKAFVKLNLETSYKVEKYQ